MAFFLVLICLAVLAINSWTLWNSWEDDLSDSMSQAKNLSVSLARQAEDTFLQTEITLTDVIRDIGIKGDAIVVLPGFTQELAERQKILPQLHGLFIYDAQGNWLATSGSYVPAKANNSDREYFIYHRSHNDTNVHIGHVITSRSTGDLVIPVSRRLNDAQGNFSGVLLATVKVDYFKHFYNYYEIGAQDVLGLIMTDGTLLCVRPLPDSFINKNIASSPLFTKALKTSDSGNAIWRSHLDNVDRVFGYSRLMRYPLVVTAGYAVNDIWRQWVADHLTDALLNILLLIVILLMGFFVLRQVNANLKNQLELTKVRDELATINHTLQSLALFDGLTGLANRRQFDIFLSQTLQFAAKTGGTVSLLMMDIDFFKRYNDTYGHVAGDDCLKKVGRALGLLSPGDTDLIARYGGEEFAIILPRAASPAAQRMAISVVDAIRGLALLHEKTDVPGKVVTISVGCYTAIAAGTENEAAIFIENADRALYDAKQNGRNRVVVNEQ